MGLLVVSIEFTGVHSAPCRSRPTKRVKRVHQGLINQTEGLNVLFQPIAGMLDLAQWNTFVAAAERGKHGR